MGLGAAEAAPEEVVAAALPAAAAVVVVAAAAAAEACSQRCYQLRRLAHKTRGRCGVLTMAGREAVAAEAVAEAGAGAVVAAAVAAPELSRRLLVLPRRLLGPQA